MENVNINTTYENVWYKFQEYVRKSSIHTQFIPAITSADEQNSVYLTQ